MNKREIIKGYDLRGEPPFLGMPAKFHDHCLRLAGRVGGRVLDIGCGHGILLERILGQGAPTQAWGCDLSSILCARTRARNPGATVLQADAGDLPFADDSFDHVFMVEVLEHLPEAERALCEVKRVLRGRGQFLVAVPNRDWFHYAEHMRRREKHRPLEADWHWYGAAEIQRLLRGVGFTPRRLRGGENLYFGGGLPRGLEKLALCVAPWLHERSKRLIILSVNDK